MVARRSRRTALLIPMALVVGVSGSLATACADAPDGASGGSPTLAADGFDYSSLSGQLDGGGSSFQDALQQAVKVEFAKVAPRVTVNYAKSGSGQGKQDLANQVTTYAGTDSVVKDEERPNFKGGGFLYFPVGAAPITVTYNLDGVAGLKLSADAVAGIFAGSIRRWDDPAIAAVNPGTALPDTQIAVVHRSDKSGTTANFTRYLSRAAPTVWTLGSGDEVRWPTSTQGAEKNTGVATAVAATSGAVGYIDLLDAVAAQETNPSLGFALVRNRAGNYVEPKLPGATAALANTTLDDDLTFDPLDAPGEASYPITAPTWVLTYATYPDAGLVAALKGWLHFFLTSGQTVSEWNGYAKLPQSYQQRTLAQVETIAAG